MSKCELCGEPMPAGEEMFKFHGYSGPCPKPASQQTEAEKLAAAKDAAHRALDAAEKAWYAYAGMADVGPERTRAFEVYESVRCARRVF